MHLLELANEALGMSMFERDDMLVFLAYSNQLNTKTKIEQILHFKNGWAYLPYAEHSNADLPRITQFKLYVLFSIYGRVFKRKREELRRHKYLVNFKMQSYEDLGRIQQLSYGSTKLGEFSTSTKSQVSSNTSIIRFFDGRSRGVCKLKKKKPTIAAPMISRTTTVTKKETKKNKSLITDDVISFVE